MSRPRSFALSLARYISDPAILLPRFDSEFCDSLVLSWSMCAWKSSDYHRSLRYNFPSSARMMKAGIPDAWGFVSFADRNCGMCGMHYL